VCEALAGDNLHLGGHPKPATDGHLKTGQRGQDATADALSGAGDAKRALSPPRWPQHRQPYAITADRFEAVAHLSLRDAAQVLGVSRSVVHRFRLSRQPLESGVDSVTKSATQQPAAA
jgi:hypothetical protein